MVEHYVTVKSNARPNTHNFILWVLRREQQSLVRHLREEVELVLITPAQYLTATSAWAQTGTRLAALFSGQYLLTSRFYQLCGELAHKKDQLQRLGDEGGNQRIIADLRRELSLLSAIAHPKPMAK